MKVAFTYKLIKDTYIYTAPRLHTHTHTHQKMGAWSFFWLFCSLSLSPSLSRTHFPSLDFLSPYLSSLRRTHPKYLHHPASNTAHQMEEWKKERRRRRKRRRWRRKKKKGVYPRNSLVPSLHIHTHTRNCTHSSIHPSIHPCIHAQAILTYLDTCMHSLYMYVCMHAHKQANNALQ